MRAARQLLWSALAVIAVLGLTAAPAQAQGKHKHYAVSSDRAVSVTRIVLVGQGYQVVRVERMGPTHVVYFRRGNKGHGRGKGPVQRMVIRTINDRVTFEDAEPSILVDIDLKLKL